MSWSFGMNVKHQCFDCLSLIGLRDRLRCPKCRAVGTWKPHGGWLDKLSDWRTGLKAMLLPGVRYATERRWVCKYCGYTRDCDGEHYGAPNAVKKVWDYKTEDSLPTPKEAVERLCGSTWPWRG